MEKVLDCLLLCAMAIDQVFGGAAQDDLPGDANGGIFLEADGRLFLVPIVKDDRDTSFRYSGLAALVNEILKTR